MHGHGKWEWACIGKNTLMVVSRNGEGLMQNAWKGRKLKSEIPQSNKYMADVMIKLNRELIGAAARRTGAVRN